MNLAWLVIDLQRKFYNGKNKESMDEACEYIDTVLPFFREKNLPVVWIQHMNEKSGLLPGTEGFELLECLKPIAGEKVISKKYGNSFNKTDCYAYLKERNIDTVILSGFCAEYCVLSTYRGALDLDLTPIILKGSLASGNEKYIQFVENISNLITYKVLEKILHG